jgi:50S ribosome-binding GTPase
MTLILVGETGVGKTAFLSLLANICACRRVDDFQLENQAGNETGLSRDQSQTNEAMLYTFKNMHNQVLRVLDTPGLSDTRGLDQDIQHTESIVKAIQTKIKTVDGILFMANGTLERAGPGIEYAMHMLSAIFPRTMAKNIGLLFTNVPDALSFNFNSDTLPACVTNSELWTIQNPLAQVMRFRETVSGKAKQSEKQLLTFRKLLDDNYSATIDTLNDMFDWFNKHTAQKTQDVLKLHAMSQNLELAVGAVYSQAILRDTAQDQIARLQTDLIRHNQVRKKQFYIF